MTERQERLLREALVPELDESRLNRQWVNVRSGLDRRATPTWNQLAILTGTAAALAAAASFVVPRWIGETASPNAPRAELADARPSNGNALEANERGISVQLNEGSELLLSERSRLEVVERSERAVELRLTRGSSRFNVHAKAPPFTVRIQDVSVQARGGTFRVDAPNEASDEVRVSVKSGEVAVRVATGAWLPLAAGQTWSRKANATTETALIEFDDEEPEGKVPDEKAGDASRTDLSFSAEAQPVHPVAPEIPSAAAAKGTLRAPDQEAPNGAGAKELFERATQARGRGEVQAAVDAYRRLLARHPGDARSGLAAFELGRLQMDRLSDTQGAIRSLNQALSASPGASFRQDALARLVRAYAAVGDRANCRRVRSSYLDSYPEGPHGASVKRACGDRPSSPKR